MEISEKVLISSRSVQVFSLAYVGIWTLCPWFGPTRIGYHIQGKTGQLVEDFGKDLEKRVLTLENETGKL